MPRQPVIPRELKLGPFSLEEARAAGISRTALQGPAWRHLARGIYCWTGLLDDPLRTLFAYQRLLPESVFCGGSAAWLHRIDIDPIHPIEIIVPPTSGIRTRHGLTVRHLQIPRAQVSRVRGLRATSPYRTVFDVCRRLKEVDALIVLDQALRLRLVDRSSAGKLHPLGAVAEPSESPMETRLRWILIKAGLPRPKVQWNLHNANGSFLGRADLYYPNARLVIEYDGINHRERLVDDNRRQNQLVNAGYSLLRFTASDIYNRTEAIVDQVSAAAALSARRPAAAPR